MRSFRIAMLFMSAVFSSPCMSISQSLAPAPFDEPVRAGEFADRRIDEASGMASSRIDDDVIWVVNDGGNGPRIFASDLAGNAVASFFVKGARNRDWEDVASFVLEGRPFLLIADVGDNRASRKRCVLYFVEEPRIGNFSASEKITEVDSRKMKFEYEDGPRDCESVAVDAEGMRVLLLTKRERIPILYSLPLDVSGSDRVATARRVGEVRRIPQPAARDLLEDPVYGAFSSQPTAMDIDSTGRYAAILTYKRAYWFRKTPEEKWEEVFSKPPLQIDIPKLSQAEAICFSPDSSELFLTSEKRPSPLYRISRKNEVFSTENLSERSERENGIQKSNF